MALCGEKLSVMHISMSIHKFQYCSICTYWHRMLSEFCLTSIPSASIDVPWQNTSHVIPGISDLRVWLVTSNAWDLTLHLNAENFNVDSVLAHLQEKAREFCLSVEAVLCSDVDSAVLVGADPLCRDLLLVSALGGLEGVECLKVATALVPEQFVTDRSVYVHRIVSSVLPSSMQLSSSKLELLCSILARSTYTKHQVPPQSYITNLTQVSEVIGEAHTAFLAPPVSQCIVAECQGSPLSRHHPPVSVTVFTLMNGPTPATKCCLKCNQCSTVYNYSMYGRKFQEREWFYSEPRQYIEVSDTVYCDRQLFLLFLY